MRWGSSAKLRMGTGILVQSISFDSVDVEFELGGDGDDGAVVRHGAADEFFDRVEVGGGRFFAHEVNFVLQDDDVLEFHDLNGREMFGCLWLWAGFITGDEQQCSVHDRGA